MLELNEPIIAREDKMPSVLKQAKANGWEAGIYDFGKANMEGTTYFNPGLVRRPDGLWLMVRRSEDMPGSPFGQNDVWAVKLDASGRNPIKGVRLKWDGAAPGQQFEDGRAFYAPHMDQVGVSACTFKWYGDNSWTGAIQVLGFFDQDWVCKIVHYIPFDTNSTSLQNIPREHFQKNWLFWMHDGKLHLLYKSRPWVVSMFNGAWGEREVFTSADTTWSFGEIRGGTPPVLVDGLFYTFFHSSMPWRGNYRRYHMGAIAFSAEPPYAPVAVTKEPLLSGSQQDEWSLRKPPCVFPCGAVYENGRWFVTYGLNDLRAGWVDIPHESVLEWLGMKPVVPGIMDAKKQIMIQRMAHAHAAAAVKRAKKNARLEKKKLAVSS